MRRILGLMLAVMFVLSHGSMSEAAPHAHAAGNAHHAVADHHLDDAAPTVLADHHGGTETGDSGDGGEIAAHVHLVAGLARPFAAAVPPPIARAAPPRHVPARLLISREVVPLLEPPTA